jgi:hypothetical protein
LGFASGPALIPQQDVRNEVEPSQKGKSEIGPGSQKGQVSNIEGMSQKTKVEAVVSQKASSQVDITSIQKAKPEGEAS